MRTLTDAERGIHRGGQLAGGVQGIRDTVRRRRRARLLLARGSEHQGGDVQWLRRDTLQQRGQLPLGRARDTRRQRTTSVGDAGLGPHHRADLEQAQVDEPARQVAAGDLDEARDERGAQEGRLVVERVGEPDGGRLPEGLVGGGVHEGVRQHLDEPVGGENLGRRAAQALLAGEPAAGRRDRQHGRDAVVADDAGDLLHQRGLVGEVGPPARRGDAESAGDLLDSAADVGERGENLVVRVVRPGERVHVAVGEFDRLRLLDLVEARADVGRRAAGQLDQQLDHAGGRRIRDIRVDTALEAPGRLARQLVPPGAARDRHRVEVRGLDQYIRRRAGDLCRSPAHHTGEADRARPVRDQQVLRVERPRLAVEGLQLLAPRGTAHDEPAADLVQIVAVDGLAQLEHHVVGDVDHQRNRPDAGEHQARDHPGGSRAGRVDPADHPGHEDGGTDAVTDGSVVGDGDVEPGR